MSGLKERDGLWVAVAAAVPIEAVVAAVKDKNPEWEVCELVNKAVYATLDFYGIERAADDE
jgi:hypothetical protein